MSLNGRSTRCALIAALSVAGLGVWSCGDDITGIDTLGDPIQLSSEITLDDFQQALTDGAARVGIGLVGDGMVAQRIVLSQPEAKAEAEAIESQIVGMEISGDDGMLTLMLDGFQVTFGRETRFTAGKNELAFEHFQAEVTGALNAGFEPASRATRPAPDQPQDPAVATFFAHELKLLERGEGPWMSINVDEDNLQVNAGRQDGEPDGFLNVLGMSVELRVSDGITELVTKETNISDAVEFEGVVASVDLTEGTFTFSDGTLVRLVEETQILETDREIQLLSLEAVWEALEANHKVVAWGGGELESKQPRVIVALELRFAIHGDDGGKKLVEFEGYVTSVNEGEGYFVLTNGTKVRVTEHTVLVDKGDGESLMSLGAVAEALPAGRQVFAYGAAEVESAEPLILVACEMRFVLKLAVGDTREFEGWVHSVNETEAFFKLGNGIVIQIVDNTQFKAAEHGTAIMSLAALREALTGHDVVAWGYGEVIVIDPLTIAAAEVYLIMK
jgi:hypothetical protein